MKLEITIQDEETIKADLDGGETFGRVQMDDLRFRTILLFRSWLETDRLKDHTELEVLGEHLYQIIFNGEIATVFENALKSSTANKERLRVRLNFQKNAIKLANLPWEFLYKPESQTGAGYFLSTKTELTLFRYMPSGLQKKGLPFKAPLKVLLVLAEPPASQLPGNGDVGTVDTRKIVDDLKALFDKIEANFAYLDNPTSENLVAKINEYKPHVLHFIGHGVMDKHTYESKIAILDKNGKLILLRDTLFAEYVKNSGERDLRLVFLHLPECVHPQEINLELNYPSFSGMAGALIKANIPAVVAMQFPIKNEVAKKFYTKFYEELAGGNDIDSAVQIGRRSIYMVPEYSETHIFGTPVLSVYNEDRIIEPIIREEKTQGEGEQQLLVQQGGSQQSSQPAAQGGKVEVTAKHIDPGQLIKIAGAMIKEQALDQEQQGVIGKLNRQLYVEKKGQGNYQRVLEDALGQTDDYQVQMVIYAMLQGLEV